MNSKTLSYIIKRILLAVLTIIIISAITFFVMHMVPGGPFNREKALDAATIKALEGDITSISRFLSSTCSI